MIFHRFFVPASLITTVVFNACHAYQHPHQHHLHHTSRWVDLMAKESTIYKRVGHRPPRTCPAVVSKPTEAIDDSLRWRTRAMDDDGDSILEAEEDLTQVIADLNLVTSEVINYMMKLVISIQSLSLRLSMSETATTVPVSGHTPTATSHVCTTGTIFFNSTTTSSKNSFFGNTSMSGFPTTSQIIQVIPITMNGSTSLSTYTSFITPLPAKATTGNKPNKTSTTTLTSISTTTMTVEPSSIPQVVIASSRSSPTFRPAPTESKHTFPQSPLHGHNGTSSGARKTFSRSRSTSTVHITVTVSMCTSQSNSSRVNAFTMPWTPILKPNSTHHSPLTTSSSGITAMKPDPGSGKSNSSRPLATSFHSMTSSMSTSSPYSSPTLSSSSSPSPTPLSFTSSVSNIVSTATTSPPSAEIPKRHDGSLRYSLTYVTTVGNAEI
ncbi:hypothetical protein HD806DRAFT_426540 [Xylariaceae sp. AK1471]|nr:hypothetical protein HD806DRAFT_426540 [Xylariaceae sp. AK1471]